MKKRHAPFFTPLPAALDCIQIKHIIILCLLCLCPRALQEHDEWESRLLPHCFYFQLSEKGGGGGGGGGR